MHWALAGDRHSPLGVLAMHGYLTALWCLTSTGSPTCLCPSKCRLFLCLLHLCFSWITHPFSSPLSLLNFILLRHHFCMWHSYLLIIFNFSFLQLGLSFYTPCQFFSSFPLLLALEYDVSSTTAHHTFQKRVNRSDSLVALHLTLHDDKKKKWDCPRSSWHLRVIGRPLCACAWVHTDGVTPKELTAENYVIYSNLNNVFAERKKSSISCRSITMAASLCKRACYLQSTFTFLVLFFYHHSRNL